jgi:hypothetical protein
MLKYNNYIFNNIHKFDNLIIDKIFSFIDNKLKCYNCNKIFSKNEFKYLDSNNFFCIKCYCID